MIRILIGILLIGCSIWTSAKQHWPEWVQLSNQYYKSKQYDSAFVYYFKLTHQSNHENIPDSNKASSFKKLGIILYQQEQYKKSIENFKQASEFYKNLNDWENEGKCWSNMANVYVKLKEYNLAESLYHRRLKQALENNDSNVQLTTHINYGYLYDYSERFDLAAKHLLEAQIIAYKLGDSLKMQKAQNNLSTMYLNRGMPDSASYYLLRSVKLSNDLRLKKAAFKNLSELHLQLGNADSTAFYLNKYYKVSNNLKNEKIALTIARLESELELERSSARLSTAISWSIAIFAAFLISLVYWFIQQQNTKQKLKESEKLTRLFIGQLKTFENEKKEMGSALHTDVLPTLTSVRNLLDIDKVEMVKEPLHESIKTLYHLHNTQFYVRRFDRQEWLTYAPTNAKNKSEWIDIRCNHDPSKYSNEYQIVVLTILEQLLQDGQQKLSVLPDEYGVEVIYRLPIQFSENTQALLSFFCCTVQKSRLHIPLFENKS